MVNEENPGESIDIKRSLVRGKYTIIEFTSPFCCPCQQVKPYLHKLNDSRPDVVVRAFDINRKGIEGIDWEAPLAMKYGVSSVPRYQIYNERGAKISDGHDASNEVTDMINKSLNPRSAGE